MPDNTVTRILRNRIALVFDFDDTLAPSTTPTLYDDLGLDYTPVDEALDEMQDGGMWQYALAKAELFRRQGSPVTEANMIDLAERYPHFPGAEDFVARLRAFAKTHDADVELVFVMLTAGYATIPANTTVGKTFDRIHAGELHFGDDGCVIGSKRIITHEAKVHYIKALAEGIDLTRPSDLEQANVGRPASEWFVPYTQIVYVGDGASDMSAYQLVAQRGGVAIAIDKDSQEWAGYDEIDDERKVHNLAKPDYTDGSELMRSLELTVESMIARIKLLRLGREQ